MSRRQDYAYNLKILFIGNSGVGKSCILMRFSQNKFQSDLLNTIGVDFKTKMVNYEGEKVKLVLWDTAGQQRFRTITNSYYRNANGILIVYDITDRDSFENVSTWYKEMNQNIDQKVACVLVGNKADMTNQRVVSYQQGSALASKYQLPFMEVSARTSNNIDVLFDQLTKQMIQLQGGKTKIRRPPIPIKQEESSDNVCNCCES